MKDAQGQLMTTHKQINKTFQRYYEKLYTAPTYRTEEASKFLENVQLPWLTPEQLETLNSPITEQDI